MRAACWASFKVLALAEPDTKGKNSLEQISTGSPSTCQSNTQPEASVSRLVHGRKVQRAQKDGLSQAKTKPGVATDKCEGARGLPYPSHACCLWPQASGVTLWQDYSGSSPEKS